MYEFEYYLPMLEESKGFDPGGTNVDIEGGAKVVGVADKFVVTNGIDPGGTNVDEDTIGGGPKLLWDVNGGADILEVFIVTDWGMFELADDAISVIGGPIMGLPIGVGGGLK